MEGGLQRVPNLFIERYFLKVCKEFQGEDQYRETLLLWVRPSQVDQISPFYHYGGQYSGVS